MRPTLALLVTATLVLLPSSSSSSAASPPPPPPSSEGGIFEVPLLAAVAGLETSPLPAVTQRHRQRRAVQQEQDGQQWVLSDVNANTEQTPTTDQGENGEFEEPLDWAHPEELRREAEEERALWRALLLETLAARSAGRGGGGKGGGEGEEEKRRREEKVRELFGELLRDDEEVAEKTKEIESLTTTSSPSPRSASSNEALPPTVDVPLHSLHEPAVEEGKGWEKQPVIPREAVYAVPRGEAEDEWEELEEVVVLSLGGLVKSAFRSLTAHLPSLSLPSISSLPAYSDAYKPPITSSLRLTLRHSLSSAALSHPRETLRASWGANGVAMAFVAPGGGAGLSRR